MAAVIRSAARKIFDPDTTELLCDVLEAAWGSVSQSTPPLNIADAANTRTMLAKYIVEVAKRGERNPEQLRDKALQFLRREKDARLRANVSAGALRHTQRHQPRATVIPVLSPPNETM